VLLNKVPYTRAVVRQDEKNAKKVFLSCAAEVFSQHTGNEVEYIFDYLFVDNPDKSIFSLIEMCAFRMLTTKNNKCLCKVDMALQWREAHLKLGQDTFIAALYAGYKSISFDWKPIIDMESSVLNKDFSAADNHYHLYGSAPSFALNFICLMNNISGRANDFRRINTFLTSHRRYSTHERKEESLYNQCIHAAAIRLYLFRKLQGKVDEKLLSNIGQCNALQRQIRSTQYLYSKMNNQRLYLDYALDEKSCERDSDTLALEGERRFLYLCFRDILKASNKKLNKEDSLLFYQYLIIKNTFRRELIQSNDIKGFRNFQHYQKRKDAFISEYKQYQHATIKLAVNLTLNDPFVSSLEARISPKNTSEMNVKNINRIDKQVMLSLQSNKKTTLTPDNFYYVLHFHKIADKKLQRDVYRINERSCGLRKRIIKQAKALHSIRTRRLSPGNSLLNSRFRGIDACANEIGCRPEVYAPAFRYLLNAQMNKPLHFTYHVGEEFIDIADGLRAIDEVLTFIIPNEFNDRKRGQKYRLGHAVALGITPDHITQIRTIR